MTLNVADPAVILLPVILTRPIVFGCDVDAVVILPAEYIDFATYNPPCFIQRAVFELFTKSTSFAKSTIIFLLTYSPPCFNDTAALVEVLALTVLLKILVPTLVAPTYKFPTTVALFPIEIPPLTTNDALSDIKLKSIWLSLFGCESVALKNFEAIVESPPPTVIYPPVYKLPLEYIFPLIPTPPLTFNAPDEYVDDSTLLKITTLPAAKIFPPIPAPPLT